MHTRDRLNQEQYEIVASPSDMPLLITAGAGTGKTRTLTERFVYLYKKYRLPVNSLLLLTFTRKAAGEMKKRILELCDLSLSDRQQLWIHTFHGFCTRLLQEENMVSLAAEFKPIDDVEQRVLFESVYSELMNLDGEFAHCMSQLQHIQDLAYFNGLFEDGIACIEQLRDKLISPDQFMQLSEKSLWPSARHILMRDMIYLLYKRFEEKMDELGVKDYPKLIMDVVEILKNNPSMRDKYQRRFVFIMVDEFQDTNHSQFELLKLLARDNLTNVSVVGDPRQSIYQWRGADPENMRWFTSAEKVNKKELLRNYRSYGQILDLAHELLKQYSSQATSSALIPEHKGKANEPVIFLYEHKTDTPLYIASEIKKMLNSKQFEPDDIVLLFRTIRGKVDPFEKALSDENIPFYTTGSVSFFQRQEVLHLNAYFRLIADPMDNEALILILSLPPYHASDGDIYDLIKQSKSEHTSLFSLLSGHKIYSHIYETVTSIDRSASLLDIYFEVIQKTNIEEYYFCDSSSEANQHGSFARYLKIIMSFVKYNPVSHIDQFVSYFTEASKRLKDEEELEMIQARGCVRLMTIYAAKGLEFPVVFLAGLEAVTRIEGAMKRNAAKPFLFDTEHCTFYFKHDDGYDRLKQLEVAQRCDELWRLYYVGITRAEVRLYLTGNNLDLFRSTLAHCEGNSFVEFNSIELVPAEEEKVDFLSEDEFNRQAAQIASNIQSLCLKELPPKRITVNCSTIHLFKECPQKYFLSVLAKLPAPEHNGKGVRWDIIGTCVHGIIDEYHRYHKKIDLSSLCAYHIQSIPAHHAVPAEFIEDAISVYADSEYARDDVCDFDAEYPFRLYLEQNDIRCELRGQIDRLYRTEHSCKILDFKTGLAGKPDDYLFQMNLYALACNKLFGYEQITVDLFFIHQKRIDSFAIKKTDLARCEQELYDIALTLSKKDFSHSFGKQCDYCVGSCSEREQSAKILEKNFISLENYYRHFYKLILAEEKRHSEQQGDRFLLRYNHAEIRNKEISEYLIHYDADLSTTRLRRGDVVQISTDRNQHLNVHVHAITHHSLSFIGAGFYDWSAFVHCRSSVNDVTFERMKDNLAEFVTHPHPLRKMLLGQELPQDYQLSSIDEQSILDEYQRGVVSAAAGSRDCLIVHGPPGTGKTVTIAHIVYELFKQGKSVLLSAYTNRAVDAILIKLKELFETDTHLTSSVLRVGRIHVVDSQIHHWCIDETLSSDRLAVEIREKAIVGITAAGIRSHIFINTFDVGIIDEASQMTEPFALGVVNHAQRIVLVGDDKQLPPVIADDVARANGLSISLFERFKQSFTEIAPHAVIMLRKQYRMNDIIAQFPAHYFYDGLLITGSDTVAQQRCLCPDFGNIASSLKAIVNPANPLVYVMQSDNIADPVYAIRKIVCEGLLKAGVKESDIGIISPFRQEVALLRNVIEEEAISIDTVDRFQGSDREVIVLSCAVDNNTLPELLTDPRRFNVALTRAKSKLIVIGSKPSQNEPKIISDLRNHVAQYGVVVEEI